LSKPGAKITVAGYLENKNPDAMARVINGF